MTIFHILNNYIDIKGNALTDPNIKWVRLLIASPILSLLLISCSTDEKASLKKIKSIGTEEIAISNYKSQLPFNCNEIAITSENSNQKNNPSILNFRVIEKKKHRTNAFTQGLIYHDGILYESTGLYGESSVSKIEYENSKVLTKIALEKKYFGEGLTLYNDELIQLTWKSGTVFRYKLPDLTLTETQKIEGEGWGITTNNHQLITSNGSSILTFRNPNTLEPQRELKVHYRNRALKNLNELEWVNGCILANVWTSDLIAIIHPDTGETLHTVNIKRLASNEIKRSRNFVSNGIAYRKDTGNLLVTGKNWQYLYEIKLLPKQN